MSSVSKMFSESWYRVAGQRITLRPQARIRRQRFRGEKWYILQDPLNNQFFRLRPSAYEFIVRLDASHTVEEVWKQCLAMDPDGAPGQEDVIQLLAQLYHANLLQYDAPADSIKLFERYKERRQREIQSKLLGIMFARFPLLDPDDFLKRFMPIARLVISPVGAVVWLATVVFALNRLAGRFSELVDQSQGVLAPGNLFLLYAALVLLKTTHEFGHSFACRRFGGEVHTMGIMLLIFTPIPYMDATSSWAFRSRWKRAFVGAAGMIVEIFVAALATFVWASTGPGTLHSLAYNMMFIASVSTLLFNGNPLLRYDGYYILSDLLDIPNLHQKSRTFLRHLAEYYAFGWKRSENPAASHREAALLGFFGIASGLYRLVVFTGILLFVADRFLLVGMIMALVCAVSWVFVPIGRFVIYLATSPRLERTRLRAVGVSVGVIAALWAFLYWVPFPSAFRAPGVLQSVDYQRVATETPGRLETILATAGGPVQAGQPLVQLVDLDLSYEIALVAAQMQQAQALERRALQSGGVDLESLRVHRAAVQQRLDQLREREQQLTVTAPETGLWSAPDIKNRRGLWLPQGAEVGELVDPTAFHFSAIISQQEASRIFAGRIRSSEVKLRGQADITLATPSIQVIPAEQKELPSAALGWRAGGEVRVLQTDPTGMQTAEPFFQVLASITPAKGAGLVHGRSGRIRFTLQPEPLVRQWYRKLRQLLQERYQL